MRREGAEDETLGSICTQEATEKGGLTKGTEERPGTLEGNQDLRVPFNKFGWIRDKDSEGTFDLSSQSQITWLQSVLRK